MRDVIKGKEAETMLACMGEHVGMWRFEPATGRVDWSERLLAMLGEDGERFEPDIAFFLARLHPEDRERVQRDFAAQLETGEPKVTRYRLRHASGAWRTLRSTVTLHGADARGATLYGVVSDVTEEVEANAALADTRDRLAAVARDMPGAIFRYIRRPDGISNIEYMSPGCEAIWELPAERLKGDPAAIWELVLPEDLEALRESAAAAGRSLSAWSHRWRIRTPSGAVKWLAGRGRPQPMPDGGRLWHTIVLDVTDEMRMREELERQGEMLAQAKRLEAVGRIAGGIAHDFNNLLAIVMGNAELLGLEGDPAEAEESRLEILRACRRGADLTQRLLSFARQSHLAPRRIDLDETVRDMRRLLAGALPERIRLDFALAGGLRPTEVDPAFLESALLNLVINARDAMPEGGRLTVETADRHISADDVARLGETVAPGHYVMLAVTDTGQGIPREILGRVTEPFFTTKGPQMGSGLGLAMVDGFVRQSGGALRLYSEPGAGATVKLFLPALERDGSAPAPRRTEADAVATPRRLAGRVLLVEDEAPVRRIVARILREAGLDVAEAASGGAALEMFETAGGAFDLLLTDVVMPGALDGPALADALRARRPGLPVAFMSGYPNEAAINGAGLAADDAFLMKPVQRDALLRLIAGHLPHLGRPAAAGEGGTGDD